MLLYRVYLGENDTSDFNVQANGHYRFRIAIRGENLLDARVATYTVLLKDNFYLSEMSGYNRYLTSYLLAAKVESSDPALRLHAELTLAEGDAAAFRFDGESGAEHSFDLAAGKLYNFPIVYGPEVFTAGNDRLSYRITVSDGYGFSQRFAVEHRMADALFVHAGDAGGRGLLFGCPAYRAGDRRRSDLHAGVVCGRWLPPRGDTFDGVPFRRLVRR